jgi:2-methylcitrate dehydratase PrpD
MPEEQKPPVTAEICRFVAATRLEDIPEDVITRGRVHILDTLGLALAGSRSDAGRIVRGHIEALGAAGPAPVLGTALRTAPRFAAMANGTAMHADNFDDTNPQAAADRNGGIHASASALAAALAVAEAEGRDGRAVMRAYHLGVEIACRLNHAVDNRHYTGGFHTTGTLGSFGAAAAAAALSGLDEARIGHALAIAASQASGIRANFGAMAEQTHAGHAAECGIAAADLAARGLTGAANVMEARFGWFDAAYLGGGFVAEAISGRLGAPWAFADPGMSIKPWPNGALTHCAMTIVAALMREHGLTPSVVERVTVRTNTRIRDILVHDRPADALQAKFSIPFAVALLLVEGQAGLAEFTDAMVVRDDIRAMMERVAYSAYSGDEPGFTNLTTFVEITLTDGRRLSERADYARGSARAPMTWDEALEKYLGCAAFAGWDEGRAMEAAELIARFEKIADIRQLTALLSG